jgi:dynein heavy chain
MDHHGWYEHKEKDKQFKELIDLNFVSAMGPPGGGKNPVTPRYLRHFNLISINNFEEVVL